MIRILLEIVLFILIARFIVNWVLPLLLTMFAVSTNTSTTKKHQPKGKIKVDYIPPKKESKLKNDAGEFVDYVEIK